MKNILLLLCSMIWLNAKAQTTVYHPFPDSSAIWNFHFQQYFCFPPDDKVYSMHLAGDTAINNQTYHQLNVFAMVLINTGNCGNFQPGYKGALRQDSAIKKVFFVPAGDVNEQLLYDFTMQVGDTVKGYISTFLSQGIDTIQSIDSVMIGNSYRKRWNTSSCYNVNFIEGVGSTYGLFELSPHCTTDGPFFSLLCFEQNGQPLFPDSITHCGRILGVDTIAPRQERIEIVPNPSLGKLHIETDRPLVGKIMIYDIHGQLIYRSENINEEIDLTAESQGIYFVEIRTNDGVINKKLVLQ